MTASVSVEEGNGAGPAWTVITVGRYCTTDSYNPVNTYPCVVPSASFNYSYWKSHRLAFSGSFTSLSNFRWYCSGSVRSNWNLGATGMLMIFKRDTGYHGCPTGNYQQAVGSQGISGTYVKDGSAGHAFYKDQTIAAQDADTFTSAAPLTFDEATYTSAGSTRHVVTQLKIATDAVQGDKANETFTFRYDEI